MCVSVSFLLSRCVLGCSPVFMGYLSSECSCARQYSKVTRTALYILFCFLIRRTGGRDEEKMGNRGKARKGRPLHVRPKTSVFSCY